MTEMDSEIEGFVTAFVLLNKAEKEPFEFLAHKCQKMGIEYLAQCESCGWEGHFC